MFGDSFDPDAPPNNASEDFSNLATVVEKPYAFWFWGGLDPREVREKIPGNHTPFFKVATQPALTIGLDAMAAAAITFLDKGKD